MNISKKKEVDNISRFSAKIWSKLMSCFLVAEIDGNSCLEQGHTTKNLKNWITIEYQQEK